MIDLSNLETMASAGQSPDDILASVCKQTSLTPEQLRGKDKHSRLVKARALVYAKLRLLGWSLNDIGSFMGRDHTTVLASLRKSQVSAADK